MSASTKTRTRNAALLAMVAAACAMAGAAEARAELGGRVALAFSGPKAAEMKEALQSGLLHRYYVVPDSAVAAAARRSGVRLRSPAELGTVGRALDVEAFVTATVARGRSWRVLMLVRRGDTGELLGRADWSDRRPDTLASTLSRVAPRRIQALLARAEVASASAPPRERPILTNTAAEPRGGAALAEPSPEPRERAVLADPMTPPAPRRVAAPVREPPERLLAARPAARSRRTSMSGPRPPAIEASASRDDARDDHEPSASAPTWLEAGAGGRVLTRSMSYADNFSRLPGYRLERAGALSLDVALFPLAPLGPGGLAGLGLTGGVTYAIGVRTELEGATGHARTEVHSYEGGLRYRFGLGPVELAPRAAYLADTFVANVAGISPDVSYRVLRLGAGTRVALGESAAVLASIDYLHVLDAGPLAARFPRLVARGMDVSLGAAYAFTPVIEAQVSVGLRRYGIDMRLRPGEAPVAGGAVDEYLSMAVGLVLRPRVGSRP